jgi:ABC-2 type transport system permease protein
MLIKNNSIKSMIEHISQVILFQKISAVVLNPLARAFGTLYLTRATNLIRSPLSLSQSLLVIWPQFVGLIALMFICFAISYTIFMRQEIRST